MRSGNPALNQKTFDKHTGLDLAPDMRMTLTGTVNKCFIMFAILLLTSMYTWNLFFANSGEAAGNVNAVTLPMMVGVFGGLIVAFIIIFKAKWAPILAPVYAGLEGLAIGGISAIFEARFPGIVIQAAGLTLLTFLVLLLAYRSGMIKATENFKLGVTAATGGIFLLYLVNMVMHMFGAGIPFIHESGTMGIVFSLIVVTIAALNLVLDFDFIETGVERGAPKYMEWYGAFGLAVTLIWLYLEILRLLAKSRR